MRAAKLLSLLAVATVAAGCRNDQSEQNITITDNVPANADIEALPPDESSATPTNELEAGSGNAAVADTNVANNSY